LISEVALFSEVLGADLGRERRWRDRKSHPTRKPDGINPP
jgi:hypothetical protein